jgi:hypothetical protein
VLEDVAVWRAGCTLTGVADPWQRAEMYQLLLDVADPWRLGVLEAEVMLPHVAGAEGLHVVAHAGPRGLGFVARLRAGCPGAVRAVPVQTAPKARRKVPMPLRLPGGALPATQVLVPELFANRLQMMLPLLERFRERGHSVQVLAMSPEESVNQTMLALCRQAALPCTPWTALIPALASPLLDRAKPTGFALLRGKPLETMLPWLHQLTSLEWGRLQRSLVRSMGTAGLFQVLFTHAIARSGARLVVTARGDGPTLRALGMAADAAGVQVIDVQHGIHGMIAPLAVADTPAVHWMLASHHTVDAYLRAGVDAGRLHRVGSLVFDQHLQGGGTANLPREPWVVYSSGVIHQYAGWSPVPMHLRVLEALDQLLDHHPDLHLLVRPHPQEQPEEAAGYLRTLRNAARASVTLLPNSVLLSRARLHLSTGSTTSVEAALRGVRSVVIRSTRLNPYFEDGAALGGWDIVDDLDDLPAVLERALHQPVARERVAAAYAFSHDGCTADRVADHALVLRALGGGARGMVQRQSMWS